MPWVVALVWAGVEVRVCALLSTGGAQGAGFGFASSDDAILECVGFDGGRQADVRQSGIAIQSTRYLLDKIQQHHSSGLSTSIQKKIPAGAGARRVVPQLAGLASRSMYRCGSACCKDTSLWPLGALVHPLPLSTRPRAIRYHSAYSSKSGTWVPVNLGR